MRRGDRRKVDRGRLIYNSIVLAAADAVPLERLRVVEVVPTLRTGGLERVATRLAIRLRPLVEHVVIATSGGEPFEGVARAAGVEVATIPRPRRAPGQLLASAWALAHILRRDRPDVVHAHNPLAGAAAAIARVLARRRDLVIVTTFHGVDPHELGRASRALALSSDVVVGVSPSVTRALHDVGLGEDRSATVFNSVDLVLTRAAGEVRDEFGLDDAELVVNVGRYVEQKNHPMLLDAIEQLRPERPRLRALLVGVGPLEEQTRAEVERRRLDGVVLMTGRRTDAVDIAAAADVFALSSRTEAMPLALLEAMGLGRAVVATDVGGISDAVVDGENGVLVPEGDAEAFADAIRRLLDDTALARRLGENAAAFIAQHCAEEAMVDSYTAIYREALQRRRARR